MSVRCAPTERGEQIRRGSYRHLAPPEPTNTVALGDWSKVIVGN